MDVSAASAATASSAAGLPAPPDASSVVPDSEQVTTLHLLEAHDLAARTAATAASFMRLGEPLSQAVTDAQVALDAPGSVDADSAYAAPAPPDAGSLAPPLQQPQPQPQQDLASTQLAAPPTEVVREVVRRAVGAAHRAPPPGMPAAAPAGAGAAARVGMLGGPPSPAWQVPGSSVASVAGSTTPSLDMAEFSMGEGQPGAAGAGTGLGELAPPPAAAAAAPAGPALSAFDLPAASATSRLPANKQPAAAAASDRQQQAMDASSSGRDAGGMADAVGAPGGVAQAEQAVQLGMHVLGMPQPVVSAPIAGSAHLVSSFADAPASASAAGIDETADAAAGGNSPAAVLVGGTSPAQMIGGTGLGAHSADSVWAAQRVGNASNVVAARPLAADEGSAWARGQAAQLPRLQVADALLSGAGGAGSGSGMGLGVQPRGRQPSSSLPATPAPTPASPGLLLPGGGATLHSTGSDQAIRPGSRAPARTRSLEQAQELGASPPPSSPLAAIPGAGACGAPGSGASGSAASGLRRFPTPVPSRRSSSSMASPMHSARASHTSLEDLVASLPALEEEGAAGATDGSTTTAAGSSSSRASSGARGAAQPLPEWYSPCASPPDMGDAVEAGNEEGAGGLPMFFPPPPEQAQQLVREGLPAQPDSNHTGAHMEPTSSSEGGERGMPAHAGVEGHASALVTPRPTPYATMDGELQEAAVRGLGVGAGALHVQSPRTPATDAVLSGAARQLADEYVADNAAGSSSSSSRAAAHHVVASAAVAAAAAANGGDAAAGSSSTGVPQVDAALPAVGQLQEQLALHGYVGRAAAIAGALVHAAHKAPAAAANLAEAALDPADVVDFTDARTNLAQPDTVPDLLASSGHYHPADQPVPADEIANSSSPRASAAAAPRPSGAAGLSPARLAPHTPERGEGAAQQAAAAAPAAGAAPARRSVFAAMVDAVRGSPDAPPGLEPHEYGVNPTAAGSGGPAAAAAGGGGAGDSRAAAADELNSGDGQAEGGAAAAAAGFHQPYLGGSVGGQQHDMALEEDDDLVLPRAPPSSFSIPHGLPPAGATTLSSSALASREGAEPEGGRSYSFQVHGAHAMPLPPLTESESGLTEPSLKLLHSHVTEPSTPPSSPHASFSSTLAPSVADLMPLPRLPSRLGSMLGGVSPGISAVEPGVVHDALHGNLLGVEEEGDETGPPCLTGWAPLPDPPPPIVTRSAEDTGTATAFEGRAAAAVEGDLLAVAASAAADAGLPPPSPRLLRSLGQAGSNPLADEEVPRSVRAAAAAPAPSGDVEGSSCPGAPGVEGGGVVLLSSVSEAPRSPRTPRAEQTVVELAS